MGPGRRECEASLWGSAVGRKRRESVSVGVPPLADLGVSGRDLRVGLRGAGRYYWTRLRSMRGLEGPRRKRETAVGALHCGAVRETETSPERGGAIWLNLPEEQANLED